ncbi:hypothetical protein CANMA_005113 [Candida margitis]|uniref:uncharacterized protein n=1 Tax=Candida margitis TaxID=1775924 RepID=UPI0022261F95|nr:uncharacterized protein CANMA_005113 [Candida margitis]KAI5952126.1 hypothetical protein CANMA_005113 [Candida margitis]
MFIRHAEHNVSRLTRCYLSTIALPETNVKYESNNASIPDETTTNAKTIKTPAPIKLKRQDVKKFYTLFKMSEFSSSMTHDDKLTKSLRLWARKSAKEHNIIHTSMENILSEAVELHKGPSEYPLQDSISSSGTSWGDENVVDDVNQGYKKPKYRYNLTSGTRRIKFTTPSSKVRRYYQFLQLEQYKKSQSQQDLDPVTKSKVIARANREWRNIPSFERFVLKTDYENLLYTGRDLSQDGEAVVSIEESERYNGVVHKVLGEIEPGVDARGNKRVPLLKFIINEMTGFVYVYGLTDFHVWNYYLANEFAARIDGRCKDIGALIKEIESDWLKLDALAKSKIRIEYLNLLSRGQDLLYGKLTSIVTKRDIVDKPKQYQVVRIRGDSSSFNIDECEISPSKFTITQPSKIRFIRNAFVGNTIIVGDLDLTHAWNYFVYKQQQQEQKQRKNIEDELQFHQGLIHQWNQVLDAEAKQQYLDQYKAMLISGFDIYMGEKMPIDTKMDKTGIKNLIVDVWGQPITQGTGRNISVDPLPMSIDKSTNKVILLSEIKDVHAYNYFLARKLAEQSGGANGVADYSKLPHLQQYWLMLMPEQKRTYSNEYLQLLNSGYDYAFGNVVPLVDKLKLSIYSKPIKLVGPGTKSAFNAEATTATATVTASKGKSTNSDDIHSNAFDYYQYSRKTIDHVSDVDQIVNEWHSMSSKEKLEVEEAYEMMVDSGFEMVNGVLKEV